MPSVCFTGRGVLRNGEFRERSVWTSHAHSSGWDVHDTVYPHTEYLVASRNDTHKAISAAARGTTVITYQEFLGLLLGGTLTEMRTRSGGGEVTRGEGGTWVWNGNVYRTRADAQIAKNRAAAARSRDVMPADPAASWAGTSLAQNIERVAQYGSPGRTTPVREPKECRGCSREISDAVAAACDDMCRPCHRAANEPPPPPAPKPLGSVLNVGKRVINLDGD